MGVPVRWTMWTVAEMRFFATLRDQNARTGQTRGHRGSHKRPQRGYYEAAGVAVYLDETRLVPPEPIMEGDGGDLNLGSDRWL